MESNPPIKRTIRKGKKIYELKDKKGGNMKLILKHPLTKLARKMRDMLFMRTKRQ